MFKWHFDQLLKSTQPTSNEAIDLEQAEIDNNCDFPSFTDEYYSLPETATSSACYLSSDHQPSDRLSHN